MQPLTTVLITNIFFQKKINACLMYKTAECVVRETACILSTNKLRPRHSSYFLQRKVLNILKSPSNHFLLPM